MVQTIKNNTCTSLYSNPVEMVFTEETTNHWLVGCTAHVIRDNIQITRESKHPSIHILGKCLILKGTTLTVQLPSSLAPQSQKNEPYLAYEMSWSLWQTLAHIVHTPTPSFILQVWQWYQCWFINSFWVIVNVQSLLQRESSSLEGEIESSQF